MEHGDGGHGDAHHGGHHHQQHQPVHSKLQEGVQVPALETAPPGAAGPAGPTGPTLVLPRRDDASAAAAAAMTSLGAHAHHPHSVGAPVPQVRTLHHARHRANGRNFMVVSEERAVPSCGGAMELEVDLRLDNGTTIRYGCDCLLPSLRTSRSASFPRTVSEAAGVPFRPSSGVASSSSAQAGVPVQAPVQAPQQQVQQPQYHTPPRNQEPQDHQQQPQEQQPQEQPEQPQQHQQVQQLQQEQQHHHQQQQQQQHHHQQQQQQQQYVPQHPVHSGSVVGAPPPVPLGHPVTPAPPARAPVGQRFRSKRAANVMLRPAHPLSAKDAGCPDQLELELRAPRRMFFQLPERDDYVVIVRKHEKSAMDGQGKRVSKVVPNVFSARIANSPANMSPRPTAIRSGPINAFRAADVEDA